METSEYYGMALNCTHPRMHSPVHPNYSGYPYYPSQIAQYPSKLSAVSPSFSFDREQRHITLPWRFASGMLNRPSYWDDGEVNNNPEEIYGTIRHNKWSMSVTQAIAPIRGVSIFTGTPPSPVKNGNTISFPGDHSFHSLSEDGSIRELYTPFGIGHSYIFFARFLPGDRVTVRVSGLYPITVPEFDTVHMKCIIRSIPYCWSVYELASYPDVYAPFADPDDLSSSLYNTPVAFESLVVTNFQGAEEGAPHWHQFVRSNRTTSDRFNLYYTADDYCPASKMGQIPPLGNTGAEHYFDVIRNANSSDWRVWGEWNDYLKYPITPIFVHLFYQNGGTVSLELERHPPEGGENGGIAGPCSWDNRLCFLEAPSCTPPDS
jgi:hypothetical protein